MIIGNTYRIESGIGKMLSVTRWRTKQIAGAWVAAFFCRHATVDQYAFEVSDSEVDLAQPGCNATQKTNAVIIRKMIPWIVGTQHHVSDGSDADSGRRGSQLGFGGRRCL
jgi:hypothetical protein